MSKTQHVQRRFVLVGPHAGKTITLGSKFRSIDFIEGVHTFTGSGDEVENIGNYLRKSYNAYPDGSPDHKEAIREYEKLTNPASAKTLDADAKKEAEAKKAKDAADKKADAEAKAAEDKKVKEAEAKARAELLADGGKIKEAILKLDPENMAHWTRDGLPMIAIVEKLLGAGGLTRKSIADAIPDYNRETALEAAKEAAKTTPAE